MPKRIPIKAARQLAKEYSLSHVIILAYDGELSHVVTYGKTTEDCEQAAAAGNRLKTAIGWPESLHAEPSRVNQLRDEIKMLREQLAKTCDKQFCDSKKGCGPDTPNLFCAWPNCERGRNER